MTRAGHVANRLTPEQSEKFVKWLESLQYPGGPNGPKISQQKVAERTGVQQSYVFYLLSREKTASLGTARTMLRTAGVDPESILGTEGAQGRYEERDKMKTRGQVLDALSAFYDEDFLGACQDMTPPPGSERWTHHRWNRHLVEMKDLWDSGYLKAKRAARHKRQ